LDNILFQALAVWAVASAAMAVARENRIIANMLEDGGSQVSYSVTIFNLMDQGDVFERVS
jgi:hypothetical protein